MATTSSYNKKSSAVKRILSEARELSQDTSTEYSAAPLEDNIFEWHFTYRGPTDTPFSTGKYHGKIILPSEFPFRPPSVMILTPNGRWELNRKICLTFTGFHEEQWLPAWGVRTAILGVQSFMSATEKAAVGIGSLDVDDEERVKLAESSRSWTCPICQKSNDSILPDPDPDPSTGSVRVVETLPEGLSVDSNPKPKAAEASGSGSSSQVGNQVGVEETTAVQAAGNAGGVGIGGATSLLGASIPGVQITDDGDSGNRTGVVGNEGSSSGNQLRATEATENSGVSSRIQPSTSNSSNSTFNSSSLRSNANSTSISNSSSIGSSSTNSQFRQRIVPGVSNSSSNVAAPIQAVPTPTIPQPQPQAQAIPGVGLGHAETTLTGVRLEIFEAEQKIATYDRAILSVCLCLVVLIVRVFFSS